jgi:hypothetical protein
VEEGEGRTLDKIKEEKLYKLLKDMGEDFKEEKRESEITFSNVAVLEGEEIKLQPISASSSSSSSYPSSASSFPSFTSSLPVPSSTSSSLSAPSSSAAIKNKFRIEQLELKTAVLDGLIGINAMGQLIFSDVIRVLKSSRENKWDSKDYSGSDNKRLYFRKNKPIRNLKDLDNYKENFDYFRDEEKFLKILIEVSLANGFDLQEMSKKRVGKLILQIMTRRSYSI